MSVLLALVHAGSCAAAFISSDVRIAPVGSRRAAVRAAGTSVDNSETSGLGLFGEGRPDGAHGTGFRFMPMASMNGDSAPALLCIAGAFPGVTAEQLLAPQPLPFPPPGKFNYHRLTGDAAPGGFVVVPGSDLLDSHPNTVAVVCASDALGLELADGGVHEVLALIDRSDAATTDASNFHNNEFYAFGDANGNVQIRWCQDIPSGWSVLGRLLYTQLPYVKKPGAGGGFAELSDDFEF